ncbi:MAG TPA: tetratricopeptide repeat protein [Bacteroidota bacterium]
MKSHVRQLTTLFALAVGAVGLSVAQTGGQVSPELAKNWSLFSEYQRNGDHQSAVPYGWTVYKLDPARFKTLYQKMAECYFAFYDKGQGAAKKTYADTLVMVHDMAIKYVPERAASHWLQKAYALENYYEGTRDSAAIDAYEKSFELDFKTPGFYYVDALGQLYVKYLGQDPSLKLKAVALYQRVLDERKSPFDQITVGMGQNEVMTLIGKPNSTGETVYEKVKSVQWVYEQEKAMLFFSDGKLRGWDRETTSDTQLALARLKSLISDPKELVDIAKKRLVSDPESIELNWEVARACMQAELYAEAEQYLQKLTKKVPDNATYWNELAKAQQRQRKFREAVDSYERALKLNTALKENFLNISLCYREMKNYTQARTYTERAAASDKGWGRPYIERGEIYKSAVEDCVLGSKGGDWSKLDINDKLVYKLAQDAYAQAKRIEPGIANEANQLSNALSTLIPSKEDYFFFRSRIQGNKMEIEGSCYNWIKEPVSVPSL